MTKPKEVPDFLAMFLKVFVKEVPKELPPVSQIMHMISLIDPTKPLKTPTFKAPQALMPKYQVWINKQMNAGILHRTNVPAGASMLVEAKSDAGIRPLVDLRFRNDNTQADHTQIPEQNTILNAVARERFRSKIDLSDAYFQTRVHPDDVKYNTIKTPFGGFTSQVMMQGDMNAPGTFVRTMEDLFHENEARTYGSTLTIFLSLVTPLKSMLRTLQIPAVSCRTPAIMPTQGRVSSLPLTSMS